ncbi:MAG TPA: tripartite tricarboxylate transporter substrate-binding protein [Burkholderiaceae bacterium]|nr:tripartite tricarboxylate transporter substrate-binding protein [Burkholderiaceae bacterium]
MQFVRKIASALLAAGAVHVQAQAWPEKPITWMVPFAAGGPTDAMARDIADKVSKQIGQQVVIENVVGAGGTIGAGKAARAPADGYTFLVGHMGYMAAAPSLYKRLSYDPVKDFEPVFRFPDTPLVLLVPKSSPYRSVTDLVEAARRSPGKITFANAGAGSTSHLIAALFEARTGIKVMPVPYKGAAPAMNDLIGGQVDAMFDQSNTALPQIKGGRLNAIALTSLRPMPRQYPHVPTLAETVLPGFEATTWYGLYAPKGTPREVIRQMHGAYLTAMRDSAWVSKMVDQGIHLLPEAQYSPESLARHTVAEVERWRKLVVEAGIQLD